MLDTVVLTIQRDKFTLLDPIQDLVAPWDLQSKTSSYEKYVKNPSARDKNAGIYQPRLTGVKRWTHGQSFQSVLKVEFSVPKLLYGNNLEEVDDMDFPQVIELLRSRLFRMGVVISVEDLQNAPVTVFHPSKNIVLSDGYTSSLILKELSKINLNQKFDLSKTSFRNDGQSLQGYTIAHSVVFYDKIADLAQSKKRAIDKDQTTQQLSLFTQIKLERPSLEILRLEIRITQKQKINSTLHKLGLPINPTFKQLFKKEICQKIVQSYWETLIKGENLFLFDLSVSPKQLLRKLIKQGKIKPKEIIYLVGLAQLCRDEGGVRDLRRLLKKSVSQRGWYRFSEGIKSLNAVMSGKVLHGWVNQIDSALHTFKSLRLKDLPNQIELSKIME